MKVGIIGAGAWGTALAILSAKSGNDVVLWSFDPSEAKNIQKSRENSYLPGVRISEKVFITSNMADLHGVDVWLMVTPARYFSETVQKGREFWPGCPIIICTKGMDENGRFMSDIVKEGFSECGSGLMGVLAGPQFAGEVARGEPAGSTIAGGAKVIAAARTALGGLTLEATDDMIGAEICGAGKNAVAILMGYMDETGAGENERALRLTECWGEITRFGRFFGAKCDTFLGLCGLGDLFLTATSKTSRNYSAGVALAKGESPAGTTEGVSAIHGITKLAQKHGLCMPNLEFLKSLV
ncbi:MAG: NAD(P)H-dependent glycerol-3-phosphate dehydrogenase [Rickettsiales bacterium]|jgi:glycerol-3-phosphate dehydrogenase (NAD(P)+)|nr:NAD(P)H-dependent glycerol-3-phosphate dehydrogenase [Rickettsiales bacterium]